MSVKGTLFSYYSVQLKGALNHLVVLCYLRSFRRRKNALLKQIGIETIWDNVESMHLGTRLWRSPQILQGWMTSSPPWKGERESL